MSKGLVTTTPATANGTVYGEFKIYANYETPRQQELGATNGGGKVSLMRSIKEIKMDGTYGPIKGKRRYTKFDIQVSSSQLVLKYLNTKSISDCESDGLWENNDWSATGGTYAAETTIVNEGSQSAKATIALGSANYGIHEVFASSADLTAFANGESSGTDDKIGFAIYITTQDLADLGSADIRVSLHCNAEGVETDAYYYDVEAGDLTADTWTTFTIAKTDFTAIGGGSETWAAITGVSVKVNAGTTAETIFYVDSFYLIQNQDKGIQLPVQGGGAEYTDEGDYRSFRPSLTLTASDYYENIAVVGQKHDGKAFTYIMDNVLNDGAIKLALQEKEEAVNDVTLSAHYDTNTMTTVPLKIRDYDV